jgi:peptide/nickel transport system permease protein
MNKRMRRNNSIFPKLSQQWNDLFIAYGRNQLAKLGTIILLLIVLLAIFAPYISGHDPLKQNLRFVLLPPGTKIDGQFFIFGTDHFGRDILSRILFGARVSLPISGLAALFAMFVGVTIGLISGYFSGMIDTILSTIIDIFLVFPLILVALSLAAILGSSQRNLIIVMIVTGWMTYARVIRAAVLSIKSKEFVAAARIMGAGDFWIIFRHLLPHIVSPALVIFTFNFSQFVILESALSFLGLGVPPPAPTWGRMLFEGRDVLTIAPWVIIFPGIFLIVTVLSVNFIGDGLRDALDPKYKRMV